MCENLGAVVSSHGVEFRLFFPGTVKDPSRYLNGGLPRIIYSDKLKKRWRSGKSDSHPSHHTHLVVTAINNAKNCC